MNPQNLRAMTQMQQAMQQLGGSGLFGGMPQPPGAASAPSAAAGGLDFSSLLGSGAGSTAASTGMPPMNPFMFPFGMPPAGGAQGSQGAAVPGQPAPGQRFRVQLQNLQDMGFSDRSANIRALTASNGNVNRAIETLLESPPEMGDSAASESAAEAQASSDSNEEAERSGDSATNEEPKGSTEKKND